MCIKRLIFVADIKKTWSLGIEYFIEWKQNITSMKNWNKLIQKIWKRIFFNLNSVKKKKK